MSRKPLLIVAALLACLQAGTAAAQSYPSKNVRILVPFAAGGPTDQIARAVSQKLQQAWNTPVIVDNKPGGGGQIAANELKKEAADGHTLFMGATENFAINQSLFKNFNYDPLVDLRMVSALLSIPMLLVVPKDSPANSVDELVALSKKQARGLNFASQGVGSIGHVLGLQFAQRTGANMNHVPYKGSIPALQDLVGNQADMMFDVSASSGQFIANGRLRALALAAPARAAVLPNVRTMTEAGYPGLDASVWMALATRAGVPDAIVNQINGDVMKAVRDPEVARRFADFGWVPTNLTLPQLNTFLRAEITRWGALIKASGATAE